MGASIPPIRMPKTNQNRYCVGKLINASIIPSEFRINVYLDTNILVDYIEDKFPLLTKSIKYLSECPYVNLKSSHYVLFEYTEVRKFNLFSSLCKKKGNKIHEMLKFLFPPKNTSKAVIKRKWKMHGVERLLALLIRN